MQVKDGGFTQYDLNELENELTELEMKVYLGDDRVDILDRIDEIKTLIEKK